MSGQNKQDFYYPSVLDSYKRLDSGKVDEAIRRAYDIIYQISPPTGSTATSILELTNTNIMSVDGSKFLTGTVPAGNIITFEGAAVATPTAAKLKFDNTAQLYASSANNLLFIVPTADKTNFLYLGSDATGNVARWKGINILSRFTGNSAITLRATDDTAGDSAYFLLSGTGSVNHTWRVGGVDTIQLTGTVFSPVTTNGCDLGSTTLKWGSLFLTTPLGIAYGGTALSTTPANGKLLIGNGTNYTSATLTGTANQIIVTNGAGSITLTTPQDINTTSTPTFNNIIISTQAQIADIVTASNVDLYLDPQGTGKVKFGTHALIILETLTGYITVKDAGGSTRKLAVVS